MLEGGSAGGEAGGGGVGMVGHERNNLDVVLNGCPTGSSRSVDPDVVPPPPFTGLGLLGLGVVRGLADAFRIKVFGYPTGPSSASFRGLVDFVIRWL